MGSEDPSIDPKIDKTYRFKLKDDSMATTSILNKENSSFLAALEDIGDMELERVANISVFKLFERFISEDDIKDVDGIDFDYFSAFYYISGLLQLKNEALVIFAKNIIKMGLLGSHSADIIKDLPELFPDRMENSSTWAMFLAFFEKIGCKVKYNETDRSVDIKAMNLSDDTNQYSADDYEFKPNLTKLNISSLDLKHLISSTDSNASANESTGNQKSNTAMKIFVCFIYLLEFSILGFDGVSILTPEFMSAFTDAFLYIHNGLDEKFLFALNTLDISKIRISFEVFKPILELINNTANITELYANVSDIPYNYAGYFSKLEVLHLDGFKADTEFFKALLKEECNLRELKISSRKLNPNSELDFKKLINLETLALSGAWQNSDFIKNLLPQISSIKILSLKTWSSDKNMAKLFMNFKYLESLTLDGVMQHSDFVKALLPCISSIKILYLCVDKLDTDAAKAFKSCPYIKTLKLIGYLQTREFWDNLRLSTPSFTELYVNHE